MDCQTVENFDPHASGYLCIVFRRLSFPSIFPQVRKKVDLKSEALKKCAHDGPSGLLIYVFSIT